MGLHGDLVEIKDVWARISWPTRILYGIMLFLSISSIASLAQTVADWKGFFLTGIEFYRSALRDPFFAWFAEHANAKFPESSGDVLTLLFMTAVPTALLQRSTLWRITYHLSTQSLSGVFGAIMGCLLLVSYLTTWVFFIGPIVAFVFSGWGHIIFGAEANPLTLGYDHIFFYALVVIIMLVIPGINPVAKTLAVGPPLAVFLLAAINKGLSM